MIPLLPRTYVRNLTTFPDSYIFWDLESDAGTLGQFMKEHDCLFFLLNSTVRKMFHIQ